MNEKTAFIEGSESAVPEAVDTVEAHGQVVPQSEQFQRPSLPQHQALQPFNLPGSVDELLETTKKNGVPVAALRVFAAWARYMDLSIHRIADRCDLVQAENKETTRALMEAREENAALRAANKTRKGFKWLRVGSLAIGPTLAVVGLEEMHKEYYSVGLVLIISGVFIFILAIHADGKSDGEA